jgi:hypothetical protein
MMNRAWLRLCSMAAVAPLAFTVTAHRDSAVTSVSVVAGAGSYAYVTRGCNNEVLSSSQRRFRDAAIVVDHDFAGPFDAGVRATVLRQMPGYYDGTVLWNPYVALEWTGVGLGAGVVPNHKPRIRYWADTYSYGDVEFDVLPFSGHLRLGDRGKAYFSVHVFEDAPVASGGGAARIGLGIHAAERADLWLGVSGLDPYDQAGFLAKADIRVSPNLSLTATGRIGSSVGLSENAGAIGFKFIVPWRPHGPRDEPAP